MAKFIPEDIMEQAKRGENNEWIKSEEFEGDGLVLQLKSFQKIKAKNPKFGANTKDALCQQEILDEGELFRYTFVTKEGQERKIDSKSLALFLGFTAKDPKKGDWVNIHKEGKMEETRYFVEISDEVQKGESESKEDEGIPF